jgi:hypothetical protein
VYFLGSFGRLHAVVMTCYLVGAFFQRIIKKL